MSLVLPPRMFTAELLLNRVLQSCSSILPILKSFPKLASLAVHSYHDTIAGTEQYQDHISVGHVAEAVLGPSLKRFAFDIWDPKSNTGYTDEGATGRRWVSLSNINHPCSHLKTVSHGYPNSQRNQRMRSQGTSLR